MKYLCLIYQQEFVMNSLSQAEWNGLMEDCLACTKHLTQQDHYAGGNALQSVSTAVTLRLRNKELIITDGPFAETKEQLAGYCLLNARDMNEAIYLVGQLPPARYGCIEIRPIREFDFH